MSENVKKNDQLNKKSTISKAAQRNKDKVSLIRSGIYETKTIPLSRRSRGSR